MIDFDYQVHHKISTFFLLYHCVVYDRDTTNYHVNYFVVFRLILMYKDRMVLIPNIAIQYLHFQAIPIYHQSLKILQNQSFVTLVN